MAFGAALALLVSLAVPSCRPTHRQQPFQARVVGVSDGDTLTVLTDMTRVKIRLNGVDCPEKGQAFGTRAKTFTSDLAFKKIVTVRPLGKDRYGRTLADVVLPDGRVLNRELVAAGLAWHYTRYSDDRALAKLERQARDQGVGIWSEARPVAPWEFRAAAGEVERR